MKLNIINITLLLVFFLLLVNCDNRRIVITKDHIINEYWSEKNNSIHIKRMKVIDSSLNIFAQDFREEPNHWNIVNKLEVDSSFIYGYNGGNENSPYSSKVPSPLLQRKVFFDRDNGWFWFYNNYKGAIKSELGSLEKNTWYKFSNLVSDPIDYYVYIDSIGKSHAYSVGGHTNF